MRSVCHSYQIWFLLLVSNLVSCQHLSTQSSSLSVSPDTSEKVQSNISWKGLTTPRGSLTTSKNLDENIEATSLDINDPVSTMIPDSEFPVMTLAPKGLDPSLFINQSPEQLILNLGVPTILRQEGRVDIWQYQLPKCVVDFFFYAKAGTIVATHTDMRSPFLGGTLDVAACELALSKINQKPVTTP